MLIILGAIYHQSILVRRFYLPAFFTRPRRSLLLLPCLITRDECKITRALLFVCVCCSRHCQFTFFFFSLIILIFIIIFFFLFLLTDWAPSQINNNLILNLLSNLLPFFINSVLNFFLLFFTEYNL